jgi:hypothetical protein
MNEHGQALMWRSKTLSGEVQMKSIAVVFAMVAISGCGVETATTAATAAAAKKQEIEQGRKTMDEVQQKFGQAIEQAQQRRQEDSDADRN